MTLIRIVLRTVWGTMLYLWLQVAWFVPVVVGLLMLAGQVGGSKWGVFVLVAVVLNWVAYWFSHHIALMHWARQITEDRNPYLYAIASEQAQLAGLPVPRLYEICLPFPNAHAIGRDLRHAVVGVSSSLQRLLDRRELGAVLAHEMAHVKNRDAIVGMVTMTVVGVVLGILMLVESYGWIGAIVLLLPAVSSVRESRADMTAAYMGGNAVALASALRKLPHSSFLSFLLYLPFHSHPPTKLRVWRLERAGKRST